jgi:hypothetical protein
MAGQEERDVTANGRMDAPYDLLPPGAQVPPGTKTMGASYEVVAPEEPAPPVQPIKIATTLLVVCVIAIVVAAGAGAVAVIALKTSQKAGGSQSAAQIRGLSQSYTRLSGKVAADDKKISQADATISQQDTEISKLENGLAKRPTCKELAAMGLTTVTGVTVNDVPGQAVVSTASVPAPAGCQ